MEANTTKKPTKLWLPTDLHKRLHKAAIDLDRSGSDLAAQLMTDGLDRIERARAPVKRRKAFAR